MSLAVHTVISFLTIPDASPIRRSISLSQDWSAETVPPRYKVFCLLQTAGTQPAIHRLCFSSNALHFGLGTTDNQSKPAAGGVLAVKVHLHCLQVD